MFYAGPLDFAGPASTSFRSTGGAAGTSYGALPQLDGTEDQADGAEDDSKVEEGEAGVEQADFGTLGTFYNPQAAGNTVEYYAQATEDVASSQHYDPIMGSASIMPIAAELAGIDGSESASASANRLLPIQSKALPPTAQVQYVHRPPAPPRIAPRLPTQTTRLILQARAAPAVIQQPVPVISSLYALPAARAPPRPPLPASAEADFGNVSYTTGGYGMDMSAPLEPTPDRPFIKVAHKSRVEISADSLQYSRPPPPPPPRLSDQYADSFGQQRGAQPTLPTPPMGRGSYIAQQQPFTSAGTGSTSRAATAGASNLDSGGAAWMQPDAGFIIMDEDGYFGAKPRDFYQVRQKMEAGGYAMPSLEAQQSVASPIEEFADDVIRIIVRKLAISVNTMTDNEQLNNYSQWLKITFLKRMKNSFPWLSIQSRNGWGANLRIPMDLLPNASLPPSSDHEYHQFRQLHAENARKELEREATSSSSQQQQQRRSRAYAAAEDRVRSVLEEVEHEHEVAEEERLRREAEEELTRELDLEAKRALQQPALPEAPNGEHPVQTDAASPAIAAATTVNGAAGAASEQALVAPLDWDQIRQDEIVNSLNDAPDPSDPRVCVLCCRRGDDKPQLGGRLLYCLQDRWIHVNCAIWTPEIYEDNHGMLQNVLQAVCRGRQTVQ